jgi:hypothetical protein
MATAEADVTIFAGAKTRGYSNGAMTNTFDFYNVDDPEVVAAQARLDEDVTRANSQEFDQNDFVMRTMHAPDMSKVKNRILAYLMSLVTHRCSRTELHEVVFSNNIRAAVLQTAIQELQNEGKVTTEIVPPSKRGGRGTMMLELVVPADCGKPQHCGNATRAIEEGHVSIRAARTTGAEARAAAKGKECAPQANDTYPRRRRAATD